MVLDSSAIVALVTNEPGAQDIRGAIESAEILLVGAPTLFETTMVLTKLFGIHTQNHVVSLLSAMGAEIVPFSAEHSEMAHDAFLKFGKGRHPASLNYGDCMSYAISRVAGHPLLFTGRDFTKTDISPVG